MNCVNAHIESDSCNFKFILSDDEGIGWPPLIGIAITVDGIDYGFVNLPWGTAYAEKTVSLPSGEVQMVFHGGFPPRYHIEIYNASDELIYTSPDFISGLFFTYQNECPNCLPLTDFKGMHIQEENQVNLSWKAPESTALLGFDIFRNDELIAHVAPDTISYSDNTAGLESGNYKYCVTPVYPFVCTLDDKCFETPINVGVKDYETHIMIYPNPATNELTITNYELRITNVELFDVLGRKQKTENRRQSAESGILIDISDLTSGVYFVKIITEQGIITKKIMKH
jgi:hypothetical protein